MQADTNEKKKIQQFQTSSTFAFGGNLQHKQTH